MEDISSIVFYVTVFIFLVIGLWAGRNGVEDTDTFLTARSTQGWVALGVNFFAAGLGVSSLFTFPQIGSHLGIFGVFAYSLAIIIPLLALALLGPIVRQKVPSGVTITEFILLRFGWAAFICTNIITLVYMSVFLISELTALGFLLETYNICALPGQIIICLTTTIYTALSGMKASLFTDNFQGWIVLALMIIISFAFGINVKIEQSAVINSPLLTPSGIALESLYTLAAANLAANIFHQGYWQRVYSAKNDKELVKSSIFASFLSFPVMFLIGMTGVLAVWAGLADENDPVAFFKIMATLPYWIHIFVLVLATAFVSSSIDTLQNGLVATIINDIFMNKVNLNVARIITALLNVPIIFIAAKGINVMTLFLIADLAAAVIVCPVFIGVLFGTVIRNEIPKNLTLKLSLSDIKPFPDAKKVATLKSDEFLYTDGKQSQSLKPEPSINAASSNNASLPNGFDFCIGVLGGVSAIVIFGTIFKGSFIEGVKLLTLPNELTAPGESIGAFLCAPTGSIVAMLTSWYIRKCLGLVSTTMQSKTSLFNGSL